MHVHKQQQLHLLHTHKRQTTSVMGSVNIGSGDTDLSSIMANFEMDLNMGFTCGSLWTLHWFTVLAFTFNLFGWWFHPKWQHRRQETTGQSRVKVPSQGLDKGSLVVLGFELHWVTTEAVTTELPLRIAFHMWCKSSDCLKIWMNIVVQWFQRLSWEHLGNMWNCA